MRIPNFEELMSLIILYGLTSMFVLIGAFTFEMYMKYKNYSFRIALDRLVMSTIVGSVASLFIISEFGDRLAFVQALAVAYLIGLLGFQILVKVSKLEFWEGLFRRFYNKK